MVNFFSKIRKKFSTPTETHEDTDEGDGYVELDAEATLESKKIVVRPYVIGDFEHIKPILDALREGHTIALVNIRPLRDKDLVELKRAINKLKKTCDAIEGDIAGFGEDWIAAVPNFAHIYRGEKKKEETTSESGVSEVTEYGSD